MPLHMNVYRDDHKRLSESLTQRISGQGTEASGDRKATILDP